MSDCTGAEILRELCGHLRLDQDVFSQANCIPCHMPYITSMFMPRKPGDRPLPLPRGSRNLAFVSQFVEIPGDVVFTVEYSVRAAQTAVYGLLHLDRAVAPITPHDRTVVAWTEALIKSFE
jgi:oleate hydratase